MSHVVLLGDSIFDNARYVSGRPAVIDQLRQWLPRGWRATLLALDGAIAADVPRQLSRLPADATHLALSVGGNNALQSSGLVNNGAFNSAAGVLDELADVQQGFRHEYHGIMEAVRAVGKPTLICTIYDAVPGLSPRELAALSVFNDVILIEAFRRGLPVLDLRLICTEPRDYSNLSPIEPSEIGGAKIVQGIRRVITGHDFSRSESIVYGR